MSKAKINLPNIKGFIQGNLRLFLEDIPGIVPDHIYEQVQYRLGIMSEDCIKKGMCPCECEIPNKQYEDRPCENNCYPPMMNEEEWNLFKILGNITRDSIELNIYKRKDILWP